MHRISRKSILCAALVALTGCHSMVSKDAGTLDQQLTRLIDRHALTGDPSQGRDLPVIDDPLAQLGKKLFFSKALGGNKDTACASCHHPSLGGGDGLSLSIGVEADKPNLLGPGRKHSPQAANYDGNPPVPRNAPTTFNVGLWDRVMFFDGRVESLDKTPRANGAKGAIRTPDTYFNTPDPQAGANLVEAQARFPVTSKEEMRGFSFQKERPNPEVRQHIEQRLRGDTNELATNQWLVEFQKTFNQPSATASELITFPNLSKALAAYQRSQVFVDSPWKSYVRGDHAAISEDAKKGALIFFKTYEEGGANCAGCHRGDFFTDEGFHVIATPQIGGGNDNGAGGTDDFGRFRATMDGKDRYAFRTPSLLNVEVTGPYGHAGAYTTLEGVVRHHLNPHQAVINYDFKQLDPSIGTSDMRKQTQRALNKLTSLREAKPAQLVLRNIKLSDAQVGQLLAFLNTLTDPCVKNPVCLSPWLPGPEDTDPDLMRLKAQMKEPH